MNLCASCRYLTTFLNRGNLLKPTRPLQTSLPWGSVLSWWAKPTKLRSGGMQIRLLASQASSAQNVAASSTSGKSGNIWRLLYLARPVKWKISAAVCLLAVSSSITMSVPYYIGKVIDMIYSEKKASTGLTDLCKFLLIIFVVGGLANFGRVYLIQSSAINVIQKLRRDLYKSVIKQELAFFDKTSTGVLVNRLSSDTQLVGESITQNVSDGLRSVVQVLAGVSMMAYVSPQLTLIGLAVVSPVAIIAITYGRFTRKITTQVQDALASATQVVEERISNIRTVRTFAQEDAEIQTYSNRISHVLTLGKREAFGRAVFFGFTGLSGNLIVLSVFYCGGVLMDEQNITVGDLTSFLLYAAFVGASLGGMTSFYTALMKGVGASTRLWELTDRQPAIPLTGGVHIDDPLQGHIQFCGINFAYPSRPGVDVLRSLNLEVPSGKVTAVVGPSGCGKSTLFQLLLGLYHLDAGQILLDGVDIKQFDQSWLRGQIGTVSQEPVLFSCSIWENIVYGTTGNPNFVEVEEASKQSNAFQFINSLPEGFDTVVGERGLMLSGGQRQRIAIARAILKNPRVLLLDEATSALDAQSEYFVQEALERVMKGRTVLTIAHRLSTIRNADTIAVMSNGKVAEFGSYQHLIGMRDGIFKQFMERQTIQA